MIRRSKSLPVLSSITDNLVKTNISFNDFNKLNLEGKQNILSYGTFVSINKNSTKEKRRKVIKYFYQNLYNR